MNTNRLVGRLASNSSSNSLKRRFNNINNRMLLLPLIAMSVLFSGVNAMAETSPYNTHETFALKIKLANDGTGIVQGIQCQRCGYNFVKITANTKVTARGVEVDILEAKKRAGKSAMVSYTPSTQEIQFIRW